MQRNTPETPRNPRRGAEHDASQPIGGAPREDDEDAVQEAERVPSFLTARELQSRDPETKGDTQGKGRVIRPGGEDEEA